MADEIDFNEAALPNNSAWDYFHVEQGTAIWARRVELDEFAARHGLSEEEISGFQATGADPSYQIELLDVSDEGADERIYTVEIRRSRGPDSYMMVGDDSKRETDATSALTHIVHLLSKFA